MSRHCYLPLSDLIVLDNACTPVAEAFEHLYLVGSSTVRPDYRDVDVRAILDDEEFDDLFSTNPALWSLVCLSVSDHLSRITGLPIDFQVQRMTEANAECAGTRNPLGRGRKYAGGMYAAAGTPSFEPEETE